MLYSEGYKGFQKGYSPRVAARGHYLRDHSTLLRAILAPLFCMGFFHSSIVATLVIFFKRRRQRRFKAPPLTTSRTTKNNSKLPKTKSTQSAS